MARSRERNKPSRSINLNQHVKLRLRRETRVPCVIVLLSQCNVSVWLNPSAQTGNERGTVSIVYSDSGSAGRIVDRRGSGTGRRLRLAGIREQAGSVVGQDLNHGKAL